METLRRRKSAATMTDASASNSRHPLRGTWISACLLGALCSVHFMATGLVFVAIGLAFWLPYSVFVIVRKPEKRRLQSLKVGIWVLVLAIVLAIHFVRHREARSHADAVVRKIERYRETQGLYPERLEEIGISQADLKEKLVMPHYSNRPTFYYANTMVAFHMWSYDFSAHQWEDAYD